MDNSSALPVVPNGEDWLRTTRHPMKKWALHYLNSSRLGSYASDVVQSAQVRAWKYLHTLEKGTSERCFLNWLRTIVRNCSLSFLKRFQTAAPIYLAEPDFVEDESRHSLPFEQLAAKEARNRIARAIDSLTDAQRAVWLATMDDDKSLREAANQLGMSLAWVRARLDEARTQLRTHLRDLAQTSL